MKYFLLALLSIVTLTGCENGQQKLQDKHLEVMEVHDVAMAKMDQIYDQISDLRTEHKQLKMVDSAGNVGAMEEVMDAIVALQKADDGMMDWMAAYQTPAEGAPVEETLVYLNGQMKEIEQVAVDIDASLENGAALLTKMKENGQ